MDMHQEVIDFIELFHPKEQPNVGIENCIKQLQ